MLPKHCKLYCVYLSILLLRQKHYIGANLTNARNVLRFIKWRCKYFWNIAELDHPTTATSSAAPESHLPPSLILCVSNETQIMRNIPIRVTTVIKEDFSVKVWSVFNARHDIAWEGRLVFQCTSLRNLKIRRSFHESSKKFQSEGLLMSSF